MSSYYGYFNYSFGVPMPRFPGESTLPYPGDITSYLQLKFLTRTSTSVVNGVFQVLLECYPETSPGVFPTVYWNYMVAPGTTFQEVAIDLWQPSYIENAGSLTLADLLGKTRYLAFYYYGGPELFPKTLDAHVDDVRLIGPAQANDWSLYD
jgi:hypothetical protein